MSDRATTVLSMDAGGYVVVAAVVVGGALFFVIAVTLNWLLRPRVITSEKLVTYESGMDPIHDTRRRFDVRFHLLAIAFLVFDVELLFLYPWATIAYGEGGNTAWKAAFGGLVFGEILIFLATLGIAYVYAWRKGVFQWR